MKLSSRVLYVVGFLIIAMLLGLSVYLQTHDGVTPCPLCILQRIVLGFLGVVFFFGAALNLKRWGRLFISVLATLVAGCGIFLAGRQVWLQHISSMNHTECGASLQYMLQILPLNEVIAKIFQGGAECAQVTWRFLNFSLAEWSLFWFILLFGLSVWQVGRVSRKMMQ